MSSAPRQFDLVHSIRGAVPDDGFVVSGVTNIGDWCSLALPVLHPKTYITSSYMETLGYAYPTSLGVKVGNPDKAVIALCGDGGFMYVVGELATAVQYGINVVAVVFNNHMFGASNRGQRLRFTDRVMGTELQNPDFAKLAESFGARGIKVANLEKASAAIQDALEENQPTVIDIETPPDLDPPYYIHPVED